MTTVNFPPDLGGDNVTIDDTDHPDTGLGNGGHRLRFVLALQQFLKVAQWCKSTALTVLGYRDAAAGSANDAASSATEAALSAVAAEEAAAAAGDSQGTINSRYYGALASDPLTRPNGSPMQAGDRYFNTTSSAEKVFNGTFWTITNVSAADLANPADMGKGDAMLAVLQPYAGAVAQTQHDINAQVVSVRNFIDAVVSPVDGVTSNQAGIAAAVAYAYSVGAVLHWPRGTYMSDANIPNFHDVAHTGPGVIKRGSGTFVVSGRTGTNNLYVAASGGADTNDGLSATAAMATPQGAMNALKNWGEALMNRGAFRVNLAAGTYNSGASLAGLRSRSRIEFCGPAVGGHPNVPTVIIDGTGQGTNGWDFQQYMLLKVQDIKFQNWGIHGLSSVMQCNMWTNNVHTANNGTSVEAGSNGSGINAEMHTRLYVSGGLHNNPNNTVRMYANCVGTVGYQGSEVANRPQITGGIGGAAGILLRDNSSAHVDYCDISGCIGSGGGVFALNQSRAHILSSNITGNYYGVRLSAMSTFINTSSTISGNTAKDVASFGCSLDNDHLDAVYFDAATSRWRWGYNGSIAPQALHHEINGNGAGVISYNSNTRHILEGDSSVHLAFGTPGGAVEAGITAAKPGASVVGKFTYNYTDDTWRVQLASADAFRFGGAFLSPITDNNKALGLAGSRWSTVYAGTGTINTSDAREKQQVQAIPEAVLRAWGRVEFCQFKFEDAVALKGSDGARWHFGLIAQRVKEAFEAEELDAFAFGVLCYDEWPEQFEERDEEGGVVTPYRPAGNRYGIRYDEALCLEMALQRRKAAIAEVRLQALEQAAGLQ
ncbi:tail fiber domain-containing protein [Cupriavidus necator]|uniref:tail fiber domain-containing protein n=1 Tax=Cupriavidus necator TaxID=106590 RepID=UPI0039C4D5A2